MKTNHHQILVLFMISLVSVLALAAWSSPENGIKLQDPTPEPFSTGQGALLDLPEDATQLEVGKEIYRLICSACHAYDGSGLTEEWIATWNPADQNCWQSKCHGYNHPEDGFYLPDSPPVVGSFVPYLFPTAMDMYDYILRTMPWQDPGTLPEYQAWAVTAYVLELNGFSPPEELGPQNGEAFVLPIPTAEPTTAVTETTPEVMADEKTPIHTPEINPAQVDPGETSPSRPAWLRPLTIVGSVLGLITLLVLFYRLRKNA